MPKNSIWKIVVVLFAMFSPSLVAQNIDSIIRDIRSEYATIVANKGKYEKVVIDAYPINMDEDDDDDDENGGDDSPSTSRQITYYIDNGNIRLISVVNTWTHWMYRKEIIEYYLKDNRLFFSFRQLQDTPYRGLDEEMPTKISEERIYYQSGKCIKYLVKEVEAIEEEIEKLLQETANSEGDCANADVGSKLHSEYEYGKDNMNALRKRLREYKKNK